MKPYPVEAPTCGPCSGMCNQGRLCPARALHRVTDMQITMEDDLSIYGKVTALTAVLGVVLAVAVSFVAVFLSKTGLRYLRLFRLKETK